MSEPSPYIIALDRLASEDRDREVGGKARQLARLIRAGLPVPDGFVVSAQVPTLDPDQRARVFEHAGRQAEALGQPLAVRSSAAIEDRSFAAAPGVFASVLGVSPDDLVAAIHQVWSSAATPLVHAYAEARGLALQAPLQAPGTAPAVPPIVVPIAVIVQRQITGPRVHHGVLYTRLPGDPDSVEMVIESRSSQEPGVASVRLPRSTGATGPDAMDPALAAAATGLELQAEELARLVAVGLDAESVIGASRGADVEWVIARSPDGGGGSEGDDDGSPSRVWLVQARAIVHPVAPPAFPVALLAFSRAEPELEWRLDATHNPDPLSPAQAGLVERMDRLGLAPYRMRVVGGYLYYAASPDTSDAAGSVDHIDDAAPADSESMTAESLLRTFRDEILPAMESLLAEAESDSAGVLEVLAAYEQFYALYAGRLTPLIGRGKRVLPDFLATHLPDGLDSPSEALIGQVLADGSRARLETMLDEVAAGNADIARLHQVAGTMATAWDIAAPPLSETPEAIEHAVAHRQRRAGQPAGSDADHSVARLRDLLTPDSAARLDDLVALARTVRDIAEIDDRLYFRAQTALRRALLRRAKVWNSIQDDDIFFLPFEQVLEWIERGESPEPILCRRMAQAARSMRTRQGAWRMPAGFRNGQVMSTGPGRHRLGGEPGSCTAPDGLAGRWTGRGTGGQVRGAAVRIDDLTALSRHDQLPDGAILVVATITPAMVFASSRAIGIVAQHGGLLDHGAAMARELGLPCVVDCPGVWNDVRSGDQLWVDGEDGMVVRILENP